MWSQMGQLFWGARFPGHPQTQMQSSGDPKCFNPFGKMDMGDPMAHLGHPIMNKPGPSIPGSTGMLSSKSETPRSAHSGHGGLGSHQGNHHSPHNGGLHDAHHNMIASSSSSKHKSDIGGSHNSGYGLSNNAHQGSNSSSAPSIPNPYSHAGNGVAPLPPPPSHPSMQAPPAPPSSLNPPPKQPSQERLKKCKAVFGQGQKELWCNKCRWKKKCIRFLEAEPENGKDQDSLKKTKSKKKIPDPPTQVPPQHYRYHSPPHDLPPIPHQQQQAWYNSVVHSITGGTGLPPELLQQHQQQQQQSRYRNPGSSSENSPSPSVNSQYHRYSSPSGHQNGSHLPPSPQFFGQMPPGLGALDPMKLAKSPINTLKPSHLHNKESIQAHKAPSFNPDAIFPGGEGSGSAAPTAGLPVAPPSSGNSTNRKCRALYGFEQKNKWCKPCRNKKRCIQFL